MSTREAKRVLMHVGTHKTGSTSIQWGLTHARDMLAAAGICYPKIGCPERWRFGQHDLAWSQIRRATHLPGNITDGRTFDQGARVALWQSLREEIDASSAHTIVISSEEFDVLDAEEIAAVGEALGDHDVTPIVFLRNIADLIESSYRTSILNGGYIRSVEEFAANQRTRIDYAAMLRDWLNISRGGRLIVMAYDDPRVRKDVVAAFVERLGLEIGELPQRSREQQNESVPAFIAELARDLFRGGATQQDVNQWFGAMRDIGFSEAARQAYMLTPPALRDALNERHAEEIARIKADPVLHGSVHGDFGRASTRRSKTITSHAEAVAALTKDMQARRPKRAP